MDLTNATWQKSSYSGGNGGNCVEIAGNLPDIVAIRDSKDQDGPALIVEPRAFAALTRAIRADQFRWEV